MDPFAVFALTVGMVITASQQAMVMEQYAARAAAQPQLAHAVPEAPPVAYVAAAPYPAPIPGWVAGASVGAQIGALASAASPVVNCRGRACGVGYDSRPVIAGALIGGLVGHAASAPPAVVYARVPEPQPVARRGASGSSREFTDHWQAFMQPSAGRRAQDR